MLTRDLDLDLTLFWKRGVCFEDTQLPDLPFHVVRARRPRSFNRPNLRYEVLKKNTRSVEAMKDLMMAKFTEPLGGGARSLGGIGAPVRKQQRVQCGIVYCLSRGECEKVAEELNDLFKTGPVALVVR